VLGQRMVRVFFADLQRPVLAARLRVRRLGVARPAPRFGPIRLWTSSIWPRTPVGPRLTPAGFESPHTARPRAAAGDTPAPGAVSSGRHGWSRWQVGPPMNGVRPLPKALCLTQGPGSVFDPASPLRGGD
jgi:hypothetical protein